MNNLRIEDYGYNDFFRKQKDDLDRSGELVVARVTQVHRESYTVVSDMGEKNARLKGSIFFRVEATVVLHSATSRHTSQPSRPRP